MTDAHVTAISADPLDEMMRERVPLTSRGASSTRLVGDVPTDVSMHPTATGSDRRGTT